MGKEVTGRPLGCGPEERVIQFGCVHVHTPVDKEGVSDSCVRLCVHAFQGGGMCVLHRCGELGRVRRVDTGCGREFCRSAGRHLDGGGHMAAGGGAGKVQVTDGQAETEMRKDEE